MISRRNVRIKVMQLLFTLSRDPELSFKEAMARYWETINSSYELLLFNIKNVVDITQFAVEDGEKRKSKYLPSDYDKNFSSKLYDNEIIASLANNKLLSKEFSKLGFIEGENADMLKKIYHEFSKEEVYLNYQKESSTAESTLEILLELYRFCRKSEYFNEIMEDKFPSWLDDKSLIVGAFKKCLKSLPSENQKFYEDYKPDDETVKDFGEQLLTDAFNKDDKLLEMIKPTLENWDHERVAIVDMILIKMAICEFVGFTSIPPKVTLNEYVEVAKNYSTAKSKDFINGVLDKLMKELESKGKINKSGRGLEG